MFSNYLWLPHLWIGGSLYFPHWRETFKFFVIYKLAVWVCGWGDGIIYIIISSVPSPPHFCSCFPFKVLEQYHSWQSPFNSKCPELIVMRWECSIIHIPLKLPIGEKKTNPLSEAVIFLFMLPLSASVFPPCFSALLLCLSFSLTRLPFKLYSSQHCQVSFCQI